MTRLALAAVAGTALPLLGAIPPAAPLLPAVLLAPILAWRRPLRPWTVLAGAFASGLLLGALAAHRDAGDCRRRLAHRQRLVLVGRLEAPAVEGRGTLLVEEGLGTCRPPLRVRLPAEGSVPAGVPVRVEGTWLRTAGGGAPAAWLGYVAVKRVAMEPEGGSPSWMARRGRMVERLHRLFGPRAPVAAALSVARREGLDPELREAFARSGTAHLLAISGFHVGLVAVLLLTGSARLVPRRPPRLVVAAAGVWAYVLFIGAPDAAVRAALAVTVVALGALRGRPVEGRGALAAAALAVLVMDPGAPTRVGAQLSFAGAAGLVLLRPGLARAWSARVEGALPAGSPARRLLRAAGGPLTAGVAATAATLPVVAWHFERVSLVGVPATLVAAPLVSLALPGVLASLAADVVHPSAGAFVAGGADALLAALVAVVEAWARLPAASVPVPRTWVPVALVGGWLGARTARSGGTRRRIGRPVRVAAAAVGAASALLLRAPAERLARSGEVEVVALDVGQGDALLLRSPRGRWILVDAGPRSERWDAGERRVLPALRRRGIRRLEALVLTHPDLDHVGGAAAVLGAVEVGVVLDPGHVRGSEAFVGALSAAEARGVPWRAVRRGESWELDGMRLEVLHPPPPVPGGGADDPNDRSVVLLLRWGEFDALLTGDAPAAVEEAVAGRVGPVEVLKVGHHGSSTSTSGAFLDVTRPGLALVSAGAGNRYGHPHPGVLARLEASGAAVLRTDHHGELTVGGRSDGRVRADTEHGRPERHRRPGARPRD